MQRGLLVAGVDGRHVVDARGAGRDPELSGLIRLQLHRLLDEIDADGLAAVANSGVSWAATLASDRRAFWCNVLVDGAREKGLGRQVEPDCVGGRRLVLIDNWTVSGSSLRAAAAILEDHGAQVAAAVVISAAQPLPDLPFPLALGWSFDDLLAALSTVNHVD